MEVKKSEDGRQLLKAAIQKRLNARCVQFEEWKKEERARQVATDLRAALTQLCAEWKAGDISNIVPLQRESTLDTVLRVSIEVDQATYELCDRDDESLSSSDDATFTYQLLRDLACNEFKLQIPPRSEIERRIASVSVGGPNDDVGIFAHLLGRGSRTRFELRFELVLAEDELHPSLVWCLEPAAADQASSTSVPVDSTLAAVTETVTPAAVADSSTDHATPESG